MKSLKTKARSTSGVDPRVYARGLKLRAELTGGNYVKGADTDLDAALVPVRELLTEWMWGKVWTRKGIDRRTLLVGGGAAAGLLIAWGVWPRSYQPSLNAGPGETIVNAFLKIDRSGQVIVIVPQTTLLASSISVLENPRASRTLKRR